MANRNFQNGGKIYSMNNALVRVDLQFIVDDSQPEGISGLTGPLVEEVLMHSEHATPSKTIAAGTILVKLQDNYNKIRGFHSAIASPNSGSDVKIDNSAMTAGVAYTITTLGNATAAKWLAIGVPAGVTPAVGVSFIALTDGGAGNTLTSRVQASAATGSGVASIEMVPQQSADINPNPNEAEAGAQFILQCRDYAGSLVAPAAGSRINLSLLLSNASNSTDPNQ